jgi:hypothetical protein
MDGVICVLVPIVDNEPVNWVTVNPTCRDESFDQLRFIISVIYG